MSNSIIELVDGLPSNSVTVQVLKALDFVVPGEWKNLVGFDHTIRTITGENDGDVIKKIRDHSTALYNNPKEGYQTAIWLYQTIDSADKAIAAAALADKIGDTFSFIPFLDKLTPKADTVQTIDLSLKLAAELIAYSKINKISLNPTKFAVSLKESYHHEALIRMVALVCIDGILPLGANFVSKVRTTLDEEGLAALEKNPAFGAISKLIPEINQQDLINESFNATQIWMSNLVSSVGLTRESLFKKLGGFIEIADDKLDYVSAFLDASMNYYEHTGIQTVARSLIKRAYSEL